MRVAAAVAVLMLVTSATGRAGLLAHRRASVLARLTVRSTAPQPGVGPAPARSRLPPAPAWVVAFLTDTGTAVAADIAWSGWLAAIAVAGLAGLVGGGPWLGAVLAVGVAAAPAVGRRALAGRSDARYEAGLPDALEAVGRALRSGGSLRQAVQEASDALGGRLGGDLRAVARATAHGSTMAEALQSWARARPLASVRLVVAALRLAAETGGAQARAVDGVAATVRDRLAIAGEVRALSSQARASALVIAAAPVVFCLFSAGADPRTATFLFRTPTGGLLLGAGLGLDAIAALWMARLTRMAP